MMSSSPHILVTGGCGYIGSHVTRQLSEAGYSVVVLDNLSTGDRNALVHDEVLVEADVGDDAALLTLFRKYPFRAVLHFAGSIVVPESVAQPLKYYDNNTFKTAKLIRACLEHGVNQFIFSSTASIYGDTLSESLSEQAPAAPTNPYSRSKLMTEWILKDTASVTPLRYVILRYFNVAGADPQARMGQRSPEATHLIKVGCEVVTGKRESITIFGSDYSTRDGTGIRDYIHVEDLAGAHVAALRYLEQDGKSVLLNCGYGRGFTVKEVLNELRNVAGDFKIEHGPRRPGDVSCLIADVSAIRRTLDWTPKHDSLNEIVATALNWERKLREESRRDTTSARGRSRGEDTLCSTAS